MDRSITLYLPKLEEDEKREESDMKQQLEKALPYILAGLIEGVVSALRNWGNTQIQPKPRMADFTRWVSAAEPGLGWPEGAFMAAYQTNRDYAAFEAIEAEPVGYQIVNNIKSSWSGTATELNDLLSFDLPVVQRSRWPKDVARLGQALRRITPMLNRIGYQVEQSRGRERMIRIEPPNS